MGLNLVPDLVRRKGARFSARRSGKDCGGTSPEQRQRWRLYDSGEEQRRRAVVEWSEGKGRGITPKRAVEEEEEEEE